jgi:Zn finger protein HypA/HybF involved in hydrogenase expression
MHELVVCRTLREPVEAVAHQHGARLKSRIKVPIGTLSGIASGLLRQDFLIASTGSGTEGAERVLKDLRLYAQYAQAGAQTRAEVDRLLCDRCGDYPTWLVAADERLAANVELSKRGGKCHSQMVE